MLARGLCLPRHGGIQRVPHKKIFRVCAKLLALRMSLFKELLQKNALRYMRHDPIGCIFYGGFGW